MTQTERQRLHIEKICKEHDILICVWDLPSSDPGWAYRETKEIFIRPIKSTISYAIALHEIGHVLGKYQYRSEIYNEAYAWLWAQENALEWSELCQKTLKTCLKTYLFSHIADGHNAPDSSNKWWSIYNG